MPDQERHNLLVNAARLHYLRRLTHQEIAERLGLSRVKVTRLLRQAVDEGVVEFRIADPLAETLDLQDTLRERFKLRQAVVTPPAADDEQMLDSLGRQAAGLLTRSLKPGSVLGIGWGRTLNAMLPYLERTRHEDVHVVSLTGGLASNSNQPNPYDTATAVAARLGARPHYLLLPAIAASEESRETLMDEPAAREVRELWQRMDLCLMSIGRISRETGIFYSLPDPAREAKKAREMGGVGDLLARPFDERGRFLDTSYAKRTITVDFAQLGKVGSVVGVGGGAAKEKAVLGALRTGVLNGIITDEATARSALEARP
jgi:DNA-binding transcriptional regulator LsrR (DeoR family)